jgi:hypothetical protein
VNLNFYIWNGHGNGFPLKPVRSINMNKEELEKILEQIKISGYGVLRIWINKDGIMEYDCMIPNGESGI